MNSLMNTHVINLKNYNHNSNDDDDSNLTSFSYSSYSSYSSFSPFSSFPPISSFYPSPSPSFKMTSNNLLQETAIVISETAAARTNLTVTAKRTKTTSSSSPLTTLPSTRQILFFKPSIAMTLPTEIIHEIFDYLEEHPVYFTRGSLVCRAWYNAIQSHLYWKRLCQFLKLPSPKPRAYKYKTYKSIVIKNWGSFCSLCLGKRKKYDPPIKPTLVDIDIADVICKKKRKKGININNNDDNRNNKNNDDSNNNGSSNNNNNNNNGSGNVGNGGGGGGGGISISSILNNEEDDDGYEEEEDIVSKPKLLHHLCTYCDLIYHRYKEDKELKRHRKKVKSSLAKEYGIRLPTNDAIYEKMIDEGNIDGILSYYWEEKKDFYDGLFPFL